MCAFLRVSSFPPTLPVLQPVETLGCLKYNANAANVESVSLSANLTAVASGAKIASVPT